MKFSQRAGLATVKVDIQVEGIDSALRSSLWNVLDHHILGRSDFSNGFRGMKGVITPFSRNLWFYYFKEPMDSIPQHADDVMNIIRNHFFKAQWFEVYDFIEFVLSSKKNKEMEEHFNFILEKELAGYRIVDQLFVKITDEQEKLSIESALTIGPFEGVKIHYKQALQHLSNREAPDYRNSIKESISAVESLASELSGKSNATLGDALDVLENDGLLHPALKKGFSALYGYTSNANGIRHALIEESDVDATDAKYFLISCSSFTNYMISKHGKGS